jgi:predicted aspartyl protease
MSEVKVEVKLENAIDRGMVTRGLLTEDKVRSFNVRVSADTGAAMLVLPQDQVEALGLTEVRKAVVRYADERKEERPVAGPLIVRVDGRAATVDCIVGPPNSEPLLGHIVMEIMDLIVDPLQQKLTPRPESPFLPELKLK